MKINAAIVSEPISVAGGMPDEVSLGAADGARVVFAGCVRNHDDGQSVDYLSYEAHPDADTFLHEAVTAGIADLPVSMVYVRHRIGQLAIGDVALLVVVDAAHRKEAFIACSDIVDEIKARVPIWKDQYFSDGSHQWSNCP